MAGTLLVLGVTLFLVGTAVLAKAAADRGRNAFLVIMPFTGLPYVRENWQDLRLAMLARVLGIFMVLVAVGIAIARDPLVLEEPWRLFGPRESRALVGSKVNDLNRFAASERAVLSKLRNDENPDLSGRLRSRPFVYDRAELINGVFSAQQGEGFIPELEVRLLIGLDGKRLQDRETILVRPEDLDAPELHVSWLRPGEDLPQTKVYRSGYRMELQLAPLVPGQLKGFLQLILPGGEGGFLSGEFVAYTNNLRYRNDRVDLTHDHPDTLEYVASQYIETQFPRDLVQEVEYRNTRMHLSRNSGSTIATVYLRNGRIEEKHMQFERAEIGWALKAGGIDSKLVREASPDGVAPGPGGTATAAVTEVPPLELTFDELATLSGQQLRVRQQNGETRTVRVLGVRRGTLQVESQVGNGLVQFSMAPAEIAGLKLASGRPVRIVAPESRAGTGEAPVEASADATREQSAGEAGPAVEEVPDASPAPVAPSAVRSETIGGFAALHGKEVEVTGVDGRKRVGKLSVGEKELRLNVRVGGGTLEYFYRPEEVESIRPLRP